MQRSPDESEQLRLEGVEVVPRFDEVDDVGQPCVRGVGPFPRELNVRELGRQLRRLDPEPRGSDDEVSAQRVSHGARAVAAGTQTLDDLCEWYTDAISSLTPAKPRFIVWGLMDAGLSWGQAGTASEHYHEYVRYVEKFLAGRFGSDFVNFRKYLSSNRALAECGITAPTSEDTASIAAGVVPRSLRVSSGSTHLIAAAHQLQANVFYRHMLKKGWI